MSTAVIFETMFGHPRALTLFMNTRGSLMLAILMIAGLSVDAKQATATDDIKQAGHELKKAGSATGEAAKTTVTATKKATKKGVNKTAKAVEQGAAKVRK